MPPFLMSWRSQSVLSSPGSPSGSPPRPQTIDQRGVLSLIDQLWMRIERELVQLQEYEFVPTRLLNDEGLDADDLDDAMICINEIDRLLVTHNYEEALSLLRGCKEFFDQSRSPFIKLLFSDMEEIQKLEDIYIVLRRIKHLGLDVAMDLCDC